MTGVDVIDVITLFRERNIPVPFSIEVTAAAFKELKRDLRPDLKMPGELELNELVLMGVKIIGKFCKCGAHPEDWE